MSFGNVSFPIHPLDTSFNLSDSSDGQICVGGVRIISRGHPYVAHGLNMFQFQPITTAASPDYDMILGMIFCKYGCLFTSTVVLSSPATVRNAYLLINYGDFVDGTTTKASPYVQLLSVTDPATAHQDFVTTRLGGVDTTGMQVFTAGPGSSPNDVSSSGGQQRSMLVIYIAISVSILLIFSAVAGYVILKRRRKLHSVTRSNFSTANTGPSYDYSSYHPLQGAPPPDETHMVQEYHTGSMYDPHAETTRAQVAHVHERDHYVSPPKYEERDPWQGR